MDSTEKFTPSMIRKLAPAVKLLVTEDYRNNFGQGTGFFISPEGHMLTNYHVVKGSKRIVILEDKKDYEVRRIIGFNEEADVALLETDYPSWKVHHLPLRTTLIETGERIMVLGYPKAVQLGVEITSTKGNVSSIRNVGSNSLVQFTAPVSGGSSGSPIIDSRGKVAGIVTSEIKLGQGMFLGLSSPSIARHVGHHFSTGQVTATQPPTPQNTLRPTSPPKTFEPRDASSQYYLGFRYFKGIGVTQSFSEAAKWYRKTAVQGHAEAQYNLGILYYAGQGVPENFSESEKWFRLAAEQGHAAAQFYMGLAYDFGRGVPQNYSEAAKWYRMAAEQGDVGGQLSLASVYYQGKHVPKNLKTAYIWYCIAAANSSGSLHDFASEKRDMVARFLTPKQLRECQRIASEWRPKN